MSHQSRSRDSVSERAALVCLVAGGASRAESEESLEELGGLAAAAGATVVLRMVQERQRPDPATFIGSGKVTALATACAEADIDVVIFDNELSPAQSRQLEQRLERKVLDRTQLILDIFARRARTREGRWQVELAQLQYMLPRLVGRGAELSRLGGGIGTRGPGETRLETDRRRIRARIQAIEQAINQLRGRRERMRDRRRRQGLPTVALVGYTNAGKTTLFNRLAREEAVASNAPFVTLDPLVREVRLPGGAAFLLTDTVGFIERLPHALVAAFRATLEEVAAADLVLHVIDAASHRRERAIAAVRRVLSEVGAAEVPCIEVYNKVDLLDPVERRGLAVARPEAVLVSAVDGDGVNGLLTSVTRVLGLDTCRFEAAFDTGDPDDQRAIRQLHRVGRVISQVVRDGRLLIEAEVPRRLRSRYPGGEPRT